MGAVDGSGLRRSWGLTKRLASYQQFEIFASSSAALMVLLVSPPMRLMHPYLT